MEELIDELKSSINLAAWSRFIAMQDHSLLSTPLLRASAEGAMRLLIEGAEQLPNSGLQFKELVVSECSFEDATLQCYVAMHMPFKSEFSQGSTFACGFSAVRPLFFFGLVDWDSAIVNGTRAPILPVGSRTWFPSAIIEVFIRVAAESARRFGYIGVEPDEPALFRRVADDLRNIDNSGVATVSDILFSSYGDACWPVKF